MRPYPTLLLIILMAVIGWNLGGEHIKPVNAPAASPRRERPVRTEPARVGPAREAEKRMTALRAISNAEDRTRATIELACSLPTADFANWLDGDWFTLREGMDLTLFTRILLSRWKHEDTDGLLGWSMEHDSEVFTSLLSDLAESDPQHLLDFFKSHPSYDEIHALSLIAEHHPVAALRRFQEMLAADGVEIGYDRHVRDLIETLAKNSSAALTAALDTFPEETRFEAECRLIGERLTASFPTEIRKIWDQPDGLQRFEKLLRLTFGTDQNGALIGKLLNELPNLPAPWRERIISDPSAYIDDDSAAKWLGCDLEGCGFSSGEALQIRVSALNRLARENPEAALRRMPGLDMSMEDRLMLVNNVFTGYGKKPENAENLLALLTNDTDRRFAQELLDRYSSARTEPVGNNPDEWLALATSDKGMPSYYLSRPNSWEPEQVEFLTNRFNSLPADKKLKAARILITESNPLQGQALGLLLRNQWDAPPIEPDPFADSSIEGLLENNEARKARLATDYAISLGGKEPDAAARWISGLPDESPKFWAAKNLHAIWSLHDPAAADRWMKSLPASTRSKIESLGKK